MKLNLKRREKNTKEKTKLEACHEIAKKRLLQLIFGGNSTDKEKMHEKNTFQQMI